jgi:ubiquinone/menaquinone biosynthesis C-methylase UbiE
VSHLFFALKLAAVLLFVFWVLSQVRKPTGPLGKRMVRTMNLTHAGLTDWGLRHVTVARNATVLDIGCGGGRTLQKLAEQAAQGMVHGVDFSKASVEASRQTNADEIARGHVEIELASVAALPFPDRTFDVITAVETHYYWPDRPANVREVLRVLKPGGSFAIIAEIYRAGASSAIMSVVMALIRAAYLTDAEHRELLTQAGFAGVETFHEPGTTWICAIGKRAE